LVNKKANKNCKVSLVYQTIALLTVNTRSVHNVLINIGCKLANSMSREINDKLAVQENCKIKLKIYHHSHKQ